MGDVTIELGFDDHERARVASLYWEAFGRKLRPAFRDEPTGIAVVTTGLQPRHVLVARRDGSLVGVCGFYGAGGGALELTWSHLRRVLSVPAAWRALVVLSVLSRSARPGALVLDGICVESAARGSGIGTALLNAATARARAEGARCVVLSVIEDNPRARALYERLGFTAREQGSLGPLRRVYGFDRFTTMEREIA